MKTFVHDGSVDGLLCALALAVGAEGPARVEAEFNWSGDLFEERIVVGDKASEAGAALSTRLRGKTPQVFRHVIRTWSAECPGYGDALVEYVRLALTMSREVDAFVAHPGVRRIHELSGRVGMEIHRMKGLLRFRELENGVLWAPASPDYNVILPVAFHFRRRNPAQRWIIHDVTRGLAVVWDCNVLRPVAGVQAMDSNLRVSSQDVRIQSAWRTFHESIAVPERPHPRLQRQFMPQRYWKHLIERVG